MAIIIGLQPTPGLAAPIFNPATLPLTGWFRNYAGLPNAGSASTGTSSAKNLTLATGTAPTVGSVNGKGTSIWTQGTCLTTSTGEQQMFGTTTGAGFASCLIRATYTPVTTVNANQGYNGSGIWSDNTGYGLNVYMGMSMTTTQVMGYVFGGANYADARVTLGAGNTTNTWLALFMWWNGTNMFFQVNNGAPSSAACGTFTFAVNNPIQIGRSYTNSTNDFAGQGAEYMFSGVNLGATPANITNIYSYYKATYPAAALP